MLYCYLTFKFYILYVIIRYVFSKTFEPIVQLVTIFSVPPSPTFMYVVYTCLRNDVWLLDLVMKVHCFECCMIMIVEIYLFSEVMFSIVINPQCLPSVFL